MSNKSFDLIQSWLELQCRVVPGAIRAVVLFPETSGSHYRPVAGWPAGAAATPALSNAAAAALQKQQLVLRDSAAAQTSSGQEGDIVACPLVRGDEVCGVVAVEVSQRETDERQMLADTLRNGSAWLDLLLTDRSSISESRLLSIVEIVAATLEHDHFYGAASAFVSQLAARLKCERVSLGFRRGNHVRVDVISRSASLDSRTKLITAIAAAMEEAIDQDSSVVYPESEDGRFQVVRAHQDLAAQHRDGSVCSVPIVCHGEIL
ncbi:MAG TPA: GAF domain-containing protein, partial [Gammaproteobacteria bacterium]